MCGRFALTAPASTLVEVFGVEALPDLVPRFNVAPTTDVLCVVREDGKDVARTFRWGLIPSWAEDRKAGPPMLNARAETLATRPAFRSAFRRRRLLVIADGFYEWERADARNKVPHLIQAADGRPFAMAGLWERWVDPATGEELRTCAVITTEPNELMRPIHDRMPVILPPERWALWLDPAAQDPVALQELLVPCPSESLRERRVSRRVGDVKNQGAEVQGPWEG